MTDTPILGLLELVESQAIPEQTVNENIRWLEFFAAGGRILDRDENDPPGSPSDGDAYLIAATASGAWTGEEGNIALRVSTAWEVKEPVAGMTLYIVDEGVRIEYDGASWNEVAGGGSGGSTVSTVSAQDTDLDPAHNGNYVRFTYSGAKTLTVQDDATEPLPANGEWHIRNASASGNLTLVEDTSVTINPPVGGTLEIEPGGTVTLKRVGTDEFDLMGVTVPA